jgi:hypothetical protein
MLNDNCMTDNVPPMLLCVEELTKCSKPMEEEFFDAYEKTFLCREKVGVQFNNCGQGVKAPLFQHHEDEDDDDTVVSMDSFYSFESISTLGYLCGAHQLIQTIQKGPICGNEKEEEESSQSDDDYTDITSVVTLPHTLPCVKVGVKVNSTPTKRTHWFPVRQNPLEIIREKEPSLDYLPYEIHKGFNPSSEGERKTKVNFNNGATKSSFPLKRSTLLGIMPRKKSNDSSMFSTSSPSGTISNDSSKFSTSAPSAVTSNDVTTSCTNTSSTPVSSMLSTRNQSTTASSAADAEEKTLPTSKMLQSATAIDHSVISALGSYASVGQYMNKEGKEASPKQLPNEIAVQTIFKQSAVGELGENKDSSSSCSSRINPDDRSPMNEGQSTSKSRMNDELHLAETTSYVRPSSAGGDSKSEYQQDDASPRSVILPPPKASLPDSENYHKSIREELSLKTASLDGNTPLEKAYSSSGSKCAPTSHGSVTTNNQQARSSNLSNGEEGTSVPSFEKIRHSLSPTVRGDAIHMKEQSSGKHYFKLTDDVSPTEPKSADNLISAKVHSMHELEELDDVLDRNKGSEQSTINKNPLSGAIKNTLVEQTQPVTEDSRSFAQHSRNSSFDSLILISYEDIDKVSSSNHKREEAVSTSFENFVSPTVAAQENNVDGHNFTSFLTKYSSNLAKDTNNIKSFQTYGEALNVKPHQGIASDKMVHHQRNTGASDNESRDENDERSKHDLSIYASFSHSHVRENAANLLSTTSPKHELNREDEKIRSTYQYSSPPPLDLQSRNMGESTELRKEEKHPNRSQRFVNSETTGPYVTQLNPFAETRRQESSKYKKNEKINKSSHRPSKSNAKIDEKKHYVEDINVSSPRYLIDAKNNDSAVVHSYLDRTEYKKVEKEDSFKRHSQETYQSRPDEGGSEIQPFDPFRTPQDEQAQSVAATSFPYGRYLSVNPIHDSMRHTRNYEEQSVGKAGRNGVFDASIVDPRFTGLANPKNVNFIRDENGPADNAHVFLSNTKQALASSSPYIDNRDGQIQSFHIKQHLDFEKFKPTHIPPQPQGINGTISVLQREDSGTQYGGVSLHSSKNIIEDLRGRPMSDSLNFNTHKVGNHGEFPRFDNVTPLPLGRKTTNYFSGVEVENSESTARKQSLLKPRGTAAKIDDNETNLIIQRSLEYAQSLSKPRESNFARSFKDSRLHHEHLTKQIGTGWQEFIPDSLDRGQYKFGPEPVKESLVESLVKRKTKVDADQYKYEPELVQTYSTKINRRLAEIESSRSNSVRTSIP